jgi:hypothetical protein
MNKNVNFDTVIIIQEYDIDDPPNLVKKSSILRKVYDKSTIYNSLSYKLILLFLILIFIFILIKYFV